MLVERSRGLKLRGSSQSDEPKKMVRDKGLEAFRGYFGSSLWKMVGFKAARPLYNLKKSGPDARV